MCQTRIKGSFTFVLICLLNHINCMYKMAICVMRLLALILANILGWNYLGAMLNIEAYF